MRLRGGIDSRRRSLLALLAIGRPLFPQLAWAAPSRHDTRIIVGSDADRHAPAIEELRRRYGPLAMDDRPQRLRRSQRPTAYLALGAAAFQAGIDARLDAPIVSLFASRQAYERTIGSAPHVPSTAIFGEPAPAQQMRLVASLYRRQVTVGVLLSEHSAFMEPLLRDAASASGLRLEVVRVAQNVGLTRALNLLDSPTVLMIFPDSALYSQTSLRELLESTYRRRLPVIGFSAALVAVGTLASAYTDAQDTLAQLDGVLDQIAVGTPPSPSYPAYWRVVVNDSVARSLDVVVDAATSSLGDRP
jgi:putative tryptophan/tyrosine transport system substrate-binding protein